MFRLQAGICVLACKRREVWKAQDCGEEDDQGVGGGKWQMLP